MEAAHARLDLREVPSPEPAAGQVRLRVRACGVCRTDLHIVDGELEHPKLPLVLGHQIAGEVVGGGTRFAPGARVGVPWLGATCRTCRYCVSGRENLCDNARSPDTTSTAASPSLRSPTSASASRSPTCALTSRPRRSFARASSATGRCVSRVTPTRSVSTASVRRRTSSARSQQRRAVRSTRARAPGMSRRAGRVTGAAVVVP